MAKAAGRTAVLEKNSVAIAGIRVLNVQRDTTFIDITDKSDNGFVTLLSGANATATSQLTLTVEGLVTDQVLRDIAFTVATSQVLTDLEFIFTDAADVLTGTFAMQNYNEGNSYQEATTFSATFVSSGSWTYSPAA
jgi:predicted secreted protein